MKKSQKQWVVQQLKEKGYISRNDCLKQCITRLSSIIFILKEEGWGFIEDFVPMNDGKDFWYKVSKSPFKKVVRYVPSLGKEITTWE